MVMLFAKLVTVAPASSAALTTIDPSAVPATALPGTAEIRRCVATAGSAVAVAVYVAGDPDSPLTLAVARCTPANRPNVHELLAMPDELVVVLWLASGPAPLSTLQTTATPGTGLPNASVTFAVSAPPSSVPTSAV